MLYSCSEVALGTTEMFPSQLHSVPLEHRPADIELVESWTDQLISRKTERNLFKLSFD